MERIKLHFALKILIVLGFVIGYAEMAENDFSSEQVVTKSDSRTDLLANRNTSSREDSDNIPSERFRRQEEGGLRPEPHPFDPNLSPLNPEPNEKKEVVSSFTGEIEGSSDDKTLNDRPKQRKLRSFREMQLPGSFMHDYKHIADVLKKTHSRETSDDYYVENDNDANKKKPRALASHESGPRESNFELRRNLKKTLSFKNNGDEKELFERTRRNGGGQPEKRPEKVAFRSGQHASLLTYRSPVDPEEQGLDEEAAEGPNETTIGEDRENTEEPKETTIGQEEENTGENGITDGETDQTTVGENGITDGVTDQTTGSSTTSATNDDSENSTDEGDTTPPVDGETVAEGEGDTNPPEEAETLPDGAPTEDQGSETGTTEPENVHPDTTIDTGSSESPDLEEETPEIETTGATKDDFTLEDINTDDGERTTAESNNADGTDEGTTAEDDNTDGMHDGTTAEEDHTDGMHEETTAEENKTGSTSIDTNEASTSTNGYEGGETEGVTTEGGNTDGILVGTSTTKGKRVERPGIVIPPGSKPLDLTRNVSYIVDKASNMSYFQEYISNISLPKNQSEENAQPSNQSRLISFLLDKDISYLQDKIRNIASIGDQSRNLTFIHDKSLKLTFLEANSLNKTSNSSNSDDDAIEYGNVSFLDDQARNISFYQNNHRYVGSPGNKSAVKLHGNLFEDTHLKPDDDDFKCKDGSCKPDTFELITSKKDLPPISDVPADVNAQPSAPKNVKVKAKGDCFCMTWESPPTPPGGATVIGHMLETLDEASGTWRPVAKTKTPNTKAKFFDRMGKAKKIRLRAYSATGVGPPTDPIDILKAAEIKPGSLCACGKPRIEGGSEEPSKGGPRRKGSKHPSNNKDPEDQDFRDKDEEAPRSKPEPNRTGKAPKTPKGGKKGPGKPGPESRKEGDAAEGNSVFPNGDDDYEELQYLSQDSPDDDEDDPPQTKGRGGKKGKQSTAGDVGAQPSLKHGGGSHPKHVAPQDDNRSNPDGAGGTVPAGSGGAQPPRVGIAPPKEDSVEENYGYTPDPVMCPPIYLARRVQRGCLYLSWEYDGPSCAAMVRGNVLERWEGRRGGRWRKIGEIHNPSPMGRICSKGAGDFTVRIRSFGDKGIGPPSEVLDPTAKISTAGPLAFRNVQEDDFSSFDTSEKPDDTSKQTEAPTISPKTLSTSNPGKNRPIKHEFKVLNSSGFPNFTKGFACTPLRFNITSFSDSCLKLEWEVQGKCASQVEGGVLALKDSARKRWRKVALMTVEAPPPPPSAAWWCDGSVRAGHVYRVRFFTRNSENGSLALISPPSRGGKVPKQTRAAVTYRSMEYDHAEDKFVPISSKSVLQNTEKGFPCVPLKLQVTSFNGTCVGLSWLLTRQCPSLVQGSLLERRDSLHKKWVRVARLKSASPFGWHCAGSLRAGKVFRLRLYAADDKGNFTVGPPSRAVQIPAPGIHSIVRRSYGDIENMRPDQIPIETGVDLSSIYGKDNYDIFHYLKKHLNAVQTGKE